MRLLSRYLPRISLRRKLLLVSLVLLVIPWVGYQYVREMEDFLRAGQESALLGTARAVATVLNEQPALFARERTEGTEQQSPLYAHTLNRAIFLDGYGDDWGHLLSWSQHFAGPDGPGDDGSFRLVMGVHGSDLFMLLRIADRRIVYPPPPFASRGQGDHVEITLDDAAGQRHRYLLSTTAPGWAGAYLADPQGRPMRREPRVQAEWQETSEGYNIELRMPLAMLGSGLGITVIDIDEPGSDNQRRQAGMAPGVSAPLVLPSPELHSILRGLEQASARIWVVGRQRGVLALAGELRPPEDDPLNARSDDAPHNMAQNILRLLYGLILERPSDDFSDELSGAAYLDRPEIDAALAGNVDIRWRRSADGRALLLTASHPVRNAGEVIGAVMVEQNSNAILTLQNRALETLFNVTLVVFLAATVGLLLFATRLSVRVRRLRNETEAAISPDGRLRTTEVPGAEAKDELGDLSRSFNDLLARLGQYTRYLETMASKLSHELRTPLAVVQSSLDNLDMTALPDESQVYSRRAREGLTRLSTILQRMGEATRLEQALQQSERERIDLTALIGECIAGYRSAYADRPIDSRLPAEPLPIEGVSDLLAQLLDKLVSNAMDFARPGTPIVIGLAKEAEHARLSVINTGPPLPDEMTAGLFDSMVSVRAQRSDEPHLGLGLYIVRLIAEFHGATVRAENLSDGSGVTFSVALPLAT